jgi:hypothetical protein
MLPAFVLAATEPAPGPFIALMILGFVVGIFGHVIRSTPTIAVGIAMIFLATLLLPIVARVMQD